MSDLATVVHEVPKDLTDLYAVLNVPKDATVQENKAAYRLAAMMYHPDRKEGNAELFQAVQRAYEVLMDSKKRKYYDEMGRLPVEDARLREEALSVVNFNLIQVVDQIAQSPDPTMEVWRVNPVASVKSKLSQELVNARQNLLGIHKAIRRYKAMLKRFKNKKAENFENSPVGFLMNEKLTNLEDTIEKVENIIKIHEYAVELCDDYNYDQANDTPPPQPQSYQDLQTIFFNTWPTR